MPRFSAPFSRRKSAVLLDDYQNSPTTPPEQHSFRVLERTGTVDARSFDGGAKMNRPTPGPPVPRHVQQESEGDDNMFAGLNVNRGSGASHTTKATSADTSSRHSNASTAPSSADLANNQDDKRASARKPQAPETPTRPPTRSTASSFLDRAGRTFSFGGQKKANPPPPQHDPLPSLQREDVDGRTRAMTVSTTSTATTSTATPPKLENGTGFDLGGDFGSMFTGFDKRASTQTVKNDLQRSAQPTPLKLDKESSIKAPPLSDESNGETDDLLGSTTMPPSYMRPPPVPRHKPSFEYRSAASPPGIVEDDDARLLADSVAAGRFLGNQPDISRTNRHRQDEDRFDASFRKPNVANPAPEENMFAGTGSPSARTAHRDIGGKAGTLQNKVMTPAEFERFRAEKEREGANRGKADDDDEDEIDYDDDEDEEDKAREQMKQRRKQAETMLAYRQSMMKTTGNIDPSPQHQMPSRPILPAMSSAPQLGIAKTPSPDPTRRGAGDEEDEDVPLAILQAHGFPNKARAPSRLTVMGSNPNLRSSAQLQGASTSRNQRHSTLPAFARGLPQDPFVGAGLARPIARESLGMGGGIPAGAAQPNQHLQPPQQSQPMHPGGLVGVIASEERSRAMRRGSPNFDQRASVQAGADPMTGIPAHMMYQGGGHLGLAGGTQAGQQQHMPQQAMSPGDQAQIDMTQSMQQFMQMQMQFMQMMAANQQGGMTPQQMQMQMAQMPQMPQMPRMSSQPQPYGQYAAGQSVTDFLSAPSMAGQNLQQPRSLSQGMRTMSMVQPSSASFIQAAGGPGAGYTPSIAPSERSNVGLPGRYRPVAQGAGAMLNQGMSPLPQVHQRANTMSGALSLSGDFEKLVDFDKTQTTIRPVSSSKALDDDDDEEGWAAMQAKREKKKSMWKWKKEA